MIRKTWQFSNSIRGHFATFNLTLSVKHRCSSTLMLENADKEKQRERERCEAWTNFGVCNSIMTAKCQLKASTKSEPLYGRHHRLVCSLKGMDNRYQWRTGHVAPKLFDVSPCYPNETNIIRRFKQKDKQPRLIWDASGSTSFWMLSLKGYYLICHGFKNYTLLIRAVTVVQLFTFDFLIKGFST